MRITAALHLLWLDESAISSAEYALMLAVVSLAALVAFANVSTEVQTVVNRTSERLQSSSGMSCTSSS